MLEEFPRTIGPYRILEVVGQGGMATVYKALHPENDQIVALKVLRPGLVDDEEFRRRLWHEAQVLARLQHPHIVALHGVGEENHTPYLVMEYLEAPTLHTVIGQRRRAGQVFSPAEALKLLRPLAGALDYMHARNVIHCDLKPENILLTARGPVLTDLGLATLVRKRDAVVGRAIGTPAYMAPEQIEAGRIDRRTDVYALGILLYELLTGRVPFDRPSEAAVVEAQLHGRLPSLAFFNPRLKTGPLLEDVARRALAKRRAERWPSAGAMVAALDRAVQAPAQTPRRRTAELGSASAVDDHRMRIVLALPLAALLVTALGIGIVKSRQEDRVAAADRSQAPTARVETTPTVRPPTQRPLAVALARVEATPTVRPPAQTPLAVAQAAAQAPSATMPVLSGTLLPVSNVVSAPVVKSAVRHTARHVDAAQPQRTPQRTRRATVSVAPKVANVKVPVRKPISSRALPPPARPTPTEPPSPTVAPSPTKVLRKLPAKRKTTARAGRLPAAIQSPTAQPTVEQPLVEQPTIEQAPTEQPPMEQPTVEQPPVEQPTIEQAPTEQPPAEQPATE